ncbi:hypothetical protein PHMEG_00014306 [Phytophthora megakarya]|uniref:CCHC-type domain-containing protein n=1 Tax=Phytophthora megakarya TaxID=4795 RepID=A0A225W5S5_9STRA|nr:hypothetical protein PHMEG_00014306 [Phytophthora megakarya]
MNVAIRDEEMVNIILQGVVDSHRNVVRMFNRNNAGGAAPNLATVVNVLLGEAETDKACAAVVTVLHHKIRRTNLRKKGGIGKKAKQENRKCFFCKKKGHRQADCYGWKALQEQKTNFLSHEILNEGIQADNQQMNAITKLPFPNTKKGI